MIIITGIVLDKAYIWYSDVFEFCND